MDYVEQAGIRIAKPLYEFVNTECLPGTSIGADVFWSGFADLLGHLAPQCKALLDKRDSIQQQIDAWHLSNKGKPADTEGYLSFLRGIGYLVGNRRRSRSLLPRWTRRSRRSRDHSLWFPLPMPAMR